MMGTINLAIVFLTFAIALPYSDCFEYCERTGNTSWIKFQDNCYSFQFKFDQRISYYDAEDYCRGQGAHLASIHSQEENDFILKTMEDGRFGGRMWIGLNILAGNDTPRWSDNSAVNYQKRIHKEFYVNEKCFIMFQSGKGWRPEHCELHYAPICKRPNIQNPTPIPPVTTPAPPHGHCLKGWIQFGQKCYRFFGLKAEDRLEHKQARNACWALGKNNELVSIHSLEEQAFLTQHLFEIGTTAWIGMRLIESDEIGHDLVFGWIDNSRTDFTFWAKGHPPRGTWKNCGRLSYEGVAKGEWIADYCEIGKNAYICQRPTDPHVPAPEPEKNNCSSGYTGYRNSCYRYFPESKSQQEAEKTCQTSGGHLVSVADSFEQAFLYNFLNKTSDVWNGLQSVEKSRYLRWVDQSYLYFSNWQEGTVKLQGGQDICWSMIANRDFKWNVTSCSKKLPFVCEISKEGSPKFPEVIGQCPASESSWIDVGDEFCYHVPDPSSNVRSWDANSRYCLVKGMKMIKVNSTHQTNSLIAYLWQESYDVNMGLLQSFDKKSYIWADGSPLKFSNWDVKEPSSYPDGKNCVAFSRSTGKWHTSSCGEAGVAICQIPKVKHT